MSKMNHSIPVHFNYQLIDNIAFISIKKSNRKNSLTFDSYIELYDFFHKIVNNNIIKVIIFGSDDKNFCSGGDVHDIIGSLIEKDINILLKFTRMTCKLIQAMIHCQKPIISIIDGICVGAGAAIAMASDMRFSTPYSKTAFLFPRVGLAGCDMGSCSILPRIIGQGRASELLYTGRIMLPEEGEKWGFFNKIIDREKIHQYVVNIASKLAEGPTFAHMITKTMLYQEWNMSIDQALEAEAQAQTLCMQTKDFYRAYRAFLIKEKAIFQGN